MDVVVAYQLIILLNNNYVFHVKFIYVENAMIINVFHVNRDIFLLTILVNNVDISVFNAVL